MEPGPLDLDGCEFLSCDLEPGLVGVGVKFGVDPQSRLGCGAPDQVHHYRSAYQRSPTPVLRDMTEHPVLDLVPLARARWEMAHGNPETDRISEPLQGDLPQA